MTENEDYLINQKFIKFSSQINVEEFENIINKAISHEYDYFFWNDQPNQRSFLGIGKFLEITKSTEDSNFQQTFDRLSANTILEGQAGKVSTPHILHYRKFPAQQKENLWQDFNDECWFVPRILLTKNLNDCFININLREDEVKNTSPQSIIQETIKIYNEKGADSYANSKIETIKKHPEFEQWDSLIKQALKNIADNKYSKVVLSRFCDLSLDSIPNFIHLLEKLKSQNSNSIIFALKENQSIFFGATPEKLFEINEGVLRTEAVAGTISRGQTEKEDKLLEQALLNSIKDRNEQNQVLQFLLDELKIFAHKIEYDHAPKIKKLKNIQHIFSEVFAQIKNNVAMFDIINALFPTPAVCGFPKAMALHYLNDNESYDRGLYAGLIGYIDDNKNSEFAVTIRSGLLKENKMRIYAGCGIVEGSESIQEFEETELKFKTILSLFDENFN